MTCVWRIWRAAGSAAQLQFLLAPPAQDFVRFWNGFHSIYIDDVDDGSADLRDKRRKAYMARFKFLKAKVPSVSIARITVQPRGTPGTLDYRVFFMREDATGKQLPISPWHDVPLHNEDGTLNFICEIPKWTRAKFEVATGEDFNPIKQDTKNGVLRDYAWGDMAFNYGCFPQTWEDPAHKSADCGGCIGDNDPLDVIDIGQVSAPPPPLKLGTLSEFAPRHLVPLPVLAAPVVYRGHRAGEGAGHRGHD